MYFHGLAFYEGWISYWNLQPELFPISLEETLVYGYRAYSRLIYWLIFPLGLAISIITLLPILRWFMKTRMFKKNTDPLPLFLVPISNIGSALIKDKVIIFFLKILGILVLILTCFYVIFFVYREAQYQGYDAGFDYHLKLQKIQSFYPAALYKTKEGESYEGSIVTCSEKYCALLESGKVTVLALSNIVLSTRDAPDIQEKSHTKDNPLRLIYSD